MNSLIVNGKVLDYKFKKTVDGIYAFYIGDILIGQVFRIANHWSAVSTEPSRQLTYSPGIDEFILYSMSMVDGFKSRLFAADYMLKLQGYVV